VNQTRYDDGVEFSFNTGPVLSARVSGCQKSQMMA